MNEENILSWSKDCHLNWSDFKAESNPALFEDAFSFIKYRYTWTVNSESFGSEIKFSISDIVVTPEFHRHLSWVRTPMMTPELLEHEQGHFDLAELLKIELIENLKLLFENKWYFTRGQNEEQRKQYAREDSGVMIAKEIQKWEKILTEKNQDYDKQTDYGQNAEKQAEFNLLFLQLR